MSVWSLLTTALGTSLDGPFRKTVKGLRGVVVGPWSAVNVAGKHWTEERRRPASFRQADQSHGLSTSLTVIEVGTYIAQRMSFGLAVSAILVARPGSYRVIDANCLALAHVYRQPPDAIPFSFSTSR
jgi:hypothetical protein